MSEPKSDSGKRTRDHGGRGEGSGSGEERSRLGPREPEGVADTESEDFDPTATMFIPRARAATQAVSDDLWHIHVEVVGGPMDGLSSRVRGASFTIGRGIGNDLPLPLDQMVSARHARIVREGRHYWLEDLGSRNGTWLGDQRLSERVLIGPGTTFTAGQTHLEFMPR